MLSRLIFGDALSTWALFFELVLSGVLVVLAGSRLTFLADRLANERKLGDAWVGMLLLATVTSLPEVVAGCTAVAIGTPDLAFAALFGSCAFNITIIVWMNVVGGGGSILSGRKPAHTLTSSLGIFMIALALAGIMLSQKFQSNAWLGQTCELGICASLVLTYLKSIRITYRMERREPILEALEEAVIPPTPRLMAKILCLALVLAGAAWWMTQTGDVLSTHPIRLIGRPLGVTFVGACFLAVATSLPEIATSLAAVRIGNVDLALGNVFGSNMFNIFVIPLCKITSLAAGHPLLMAGDPFHADPNVIAGLLPILLTAVALGGLTYQPKRRLLRLGPDSVLIGLIYIVGLILLTAVP